MRKKIVFGMAIISLVAIIVLCQKAGVRLKETFRESEETNSGAVIGMKEKENEKSDKKEGMQERSEMQQRQGYQAVEKLRETLDEKYLWEVILLYAGESFKTYTGLPFTYEVRKGRNGDYTRELWIDRRENSKSLALSSVLLALRNIKKVGAVVDRPKALGDIRGVSYIYGMFYRFGLIDVPDTARQKMKFTGYIF